MKPPEWQYDKVWNRIVTKDKNGLQAVVLDKIESGIGQVIVEIANNLIRIKNNEEV